MTRNKSVSTSPSPTPPSSTGRMSELPRPHYFVNRADGTKTPLIAVDELPFTICILGVPRTLNDAQTQGMMSLGVLSSSGQCYVVQEDDESSTSSSSLGPPRQLNSGVQPVRSVTGFQAPDSGLDTMAGLSLAPKGVSGNETPQNSALVPHGGFSWSAASWRRPEDRDNETQVGST